MHNLTAGNLIKMPIHEDIAVQAEAFFKKIFIFQQNQSRKIPAADKKSGLQGR